MIVWSHLTAGLAWNASTSTRKAQKSGFPWFSWFRVGAQGGLGFGKSLICWEYWHENVKGDSVFWLDMLLQICMVCMVNEEQVECGRDLLVHWRPMVGWRWQGWPKKTTVAFTYYSILQGLMVSTIEFSAAKWYPVGYEGPWLWVCPAVIFRVGR